MTMECRCPVTFSPLKGEEKEELLKNFTEGHEGFIRGDPGGLIMTVAFDGIKDQIYNMELRVDDVWVVTYPKCGTTWTQELLWLLMNNLDFEMAARTSIMARVPFLEFGSLLPSHVFENMKKGFLETGVRTFAPTIEDVDQLPRDKPRVLKSHLPLSILPPKLLEKNKVVYVARNPKDVAVSFYHHHKLILGHGFTGGFPEFFDCFLKDLVLCSPYWPHILEAHLKRSDPNMCFIFFEDMKKDFPKEIRKIAKFLEKDLTDQDVEALANFLDFKNLKQRWDPFEEQIKISGGFNKTGSFFRKGEVGDYKNHFDDDMERRMNEWIRENLKDTDFKFPEY